MNANFWADVEKVMPWTLPKYRKEIQNISQLFKDTIRIVVTISLKAYYFRRMESVWCIELGGNAETRFKQHGTIFKQTPL